MSKRTRIVRLVIAWIVGVPFVVWMFFWISWFTLPILAGMIWITWDYYRKGEMMTALEATQREAGFLTDGLDRDLDGR